MKKATTFDGTPKQIFTMEPSLEFTRPLKMQHVIGDWFHASYGSLISLDSLVHVLSALQCKHA